MTLAEKLLAIHRTLEAAGVPHAFGGAIALGYWTQEARGTRDIDVNIFMPAKNCGPALAAFPEGVQVPEDAQARLEREGQLRLWWRDTPVDVFFDYAPLHAEAARERRLVKFEGAEIPVLGPLQLAAFKAMFDRLKDWADIAAMLEMEAFDPVELRRWLVEMVGADDRRLERLDAAIAEVG